MFRVYLINFDYYAQDEFSNVFDALEWLKSTSFEGRIDLYRGSYGSKSYPVLSWSPLRGLNWWQGLSSLSQITKPFAKQLLGVDIEWPEDKPILLADVKRMWEGSKGNG